MADAVLALPVKQSYWLIRLLWGNPTSYSKWYMTNANDDLIAAPPPSGAQALFLATPLLNVGAQPNSGTFEQRTWTFDIPYKTAQSPFLDQITSGRAKPQVLITAWEYALSPDDTEVQILTHLSGKVAKVIKNPGGKQELIRFEALTVKNDIKRAMGVPAMPSCQWHFGHLKTCGVDTDSLKENGSLDTIDGLTATITGLSAQRDRYWHRGYIEKDGIRILIKSWTQGTTFVLGKFIPLAWEEALPGVTVQLTPGCDKLATTCDLWGKLEDSFSAWGTAIPAYNPTLGVGP